MQIYHYKINSLFDELEGMSILCQGYRFWTLHGITWEKVSVKQHSNFIRID